MSSIYSDGDGGGGGNGYVGGGGNGDWQRFVDGDGIGGAVVATAGVDDVEPCARNVFGYSAALPPGYALSTALPPGYAHSAALPPGYAHSTSKVGFPRTALPWCPTFSFFLEPTAL